MGKGTGFNPYDCPKCGEPCVSPVGHVACGSANEPDANDALIGKIRKLLALAEGSSFEAEAQSAWEKAQKLMQEHAIDEALLREQDKGANLEIITRQVHLRKRQARRARKLELLRVIAGANRVRSIDSTWEMPDHYKAEYRKVAKWLEKPEDMNAAQLADALKRYQELKQEEGIVYLVGTRSDVMFVEMLWMSALMQAWRYMSLAFVEHGVTREKAAFGNSFLAGFNGRIAKRLADQNRKAEKERQTQENTKTGTELAPRNVALALRNVSLAVDEEVKKKFPNLGKGRGPSGGRDPIGYAAGAAAGDKADLSGGRRNLGAKKKELTS